MSIEEIAKKCHTRIAANNGFFDEEYFVSCIVDAINEAIASQQNAQRMKPNVGHVHEMIWDEKHCDYACKCGLHR